MMQHQQHLWLIENLPTILVADEMLFQLGVKKILIQNCMSHFSLLI